MCPYLTPPSTHVDRKAAVASGRATRHNARMRLRRIAPIALLSAALLVTAAAPGALASKRHGTRADERGDRDRGDDKRDRRDRKRRDRDALGDKRIGAGSCAKRVRELKRALAKRSYLPKANGKCMGEDERWALDAFQREKGLRPTGKGDRKTLRKLVKSERPKPRKSGRNDRLLVSVGRQLLYIVEHDRVRRTISVSSGRSGFETPRGRYRIFRKERNSFSNQFNVNLPWASYFHRGMAFHGSEDVEPRGASHGCIRVPPKFAREVYRKAPIGRQVIVF